MISGVQGEADSSGEAVLWRKLDPPGMGERRIFILNEEKWRVLTLTELEVTLKGHPTELKMINGLWCVSGGRVSELNRL